MYDKLMTTDYAKPSFKQCPIVFANIKEAAFGEKSPVISNSSMQISNFKTIVDGHNLSRAFIQTPQIIFSVSQ